MSILKCSYCNADFKSKKRKKYFCSRNCYYKNMTKKGTVSIKCSNCNKSIEKRLSQFKRGKNSFCSSSCSATYNNKHKIKGIRRSKLEKYLEVKLKEIYPDIDFHFNRSDAINSELDIYIPSLKLAFELNGIFHYEPIYGTEKLSQIKNNDNRKFQACLQQGIELCIIDTSQQKYFKESTSIKYLDIIKSIIDKNSDDGIRTHT